jgi:Uma2 family endonuclease
VATIAETPDLLTELDASDSEQRLLLHNVSWDDYLTISRALSERPSLHITYDRGTLEFTTTSEAHERYKVLFAYLIGAWAVELNIPIRCLGSKTHRRKDIERGAEPDQCFYIKNFDRIRGKRQINLLRDPPPDLVIEIEVSSSAIEKLELYAAFKVPEVWRFDGRQLRIAVLGRNGRYRDAPQSLAFPNLPIDELVRFIHLGETEDDITLIRQFRRLVRERFVKEQE